MWHLIPMNATLTPAMSALLDSSVLVAALAADELKHAECLARLLKGGNCIYSHALLETF
jgi:hypothetical protein